MREFCAFFGIAKGITALIGGGGKTSTLYALAEYLKAQGSVIVCTSTHILIPPKFPYRARVDALLKFGEVVAVGTVEGEKLTAPQQGFEELTKLADYVLVEADGARQLPLKAHAPHEPVIPDGARTVLAVVGMDGLNRPIRDAAHRPERFAALCDADTDSIATPERIARVVMSYPRVDGVILNKADDAAQIQAALDLAARFPCPVAVTAWQAAHPIKAYRRNEP